MFRSAQQWSSRNCRHTAILLTIPSIFTTASPALAADWSAIAHLNETIELNDNFGIDIVSPGSTVGALSSVDFDIGAHTPTLRLDFAADLEYQRYWGEGRPLNDSRFLRSFSGDLVKETRQTNYELRSSYAVRPATTNELTETGSSTSITEHITTTAETTIDHKINRRDTLQWDNSARKVDFSVLGTGLTPSVDLETSLAWLHKISRRTDADATASVEFFAPDDAVKTQNIMYRGELGMTTLLSHILTLTAGVGVATIESSFNNVLVPGDRDNTSITDWFGDAELKIAMKRTRIILAASRDFSPSNKGEIQTRSTYSLDVSHAINDHSSLAITASQAQSTSSDGSISEAFIVSPSYFYRFNRDWDAGLSYRYTRTDDNSGPAESNAFFFSLSREVVLLP